jgi:hypothetical protein
MTPYRLAKPARRRRKCLGSVHGRLPCRGYGGRAAETHKGDLPDPRELYEQHQARLGLWDWGQAPQLQHLRRPGGGYAGNESFADCIEYDIIAFDLHALAYQLAADDDNAGADAAHDLAVAADVLALECYQIHPLGGQ